MRGEEDIIHCGILVLKKRQALDYLLDIIFVSSVFFESFILAAYVFRVDLVGTSLGQSWIKVG